MPKVSVIMSVYNGEKYLRKSIESILNQTFKSFEFIIVNDGSTDRTSQILEDYKRIASHLRVIHQENMGLVRSLNKAIKLAKGEYIARQDVDDISFPERLEKEVVFLNEHEDAGVVGTATSIVDENGTLLCTMPVLVENENIQERLLKENCFAHGSVMFRKEAFEKVGGYRNELKYSEDYDLFLRIAEHYKVYNLKEVLYKWMLNTEGITLNKQKHMQRAASLARYLSEERKVGHSENLEVNLKGIVGPKEIYYRNSHIYKNIASKWNKLQELFALYYGFGCICLYGGKLKEARKRFLTSLKYNPLNIKTFICFFLTFLPFKIVKNLRFLMRKTSFYFNKGV